LKLLVTEGRILTTDDTMRRRETILVTGASSGFGALTARHLYMLACAPNCCNLRPLVLNVDETSCKEAIETIISDAG